MQENTQLKDANSANVWVHDILWIGASDSAESGVWKWVDRPPHESELLSEGFTNWAPGQPDGIGRGEDCVEMWTTG